jgi:predicted kinase
MQAIVLIGVQGAGKSTFYARHFADTHLRLNRDMLRTEHRLEVLFHAALAVKQPLVLDNTNPRPSSRGRFVASCKAAGYRVSAYWFDVALDEALARNRRRQGSAQVPDLAIRGLVAKLVPPTIAEGFDEILRVRVVEPEFVVEALHCSP